MSATMNVDGISTDRTVETTAVRAVQFVCPLCGEDRDGTHVRADDDTEWVECDTCSYRCDAGVLEIPTAAVLASWHAQALRHGRAAIRCADGTPSCSYLAIVWCRRLARELSIWGKMSYLDSVARPVEGELTREQREVLLRLGVALRLPASTLNVVLGER